jgi:NADH-quinone oxidoreductase subunit G
VPSVVIVGQGALREADGEAVLAHAMQVAEKTDSKLLILHTAASRVGAMDVGAVTEGGLAAAVDGADVIYNLGADEVDIAPGAFVIYQGAHGDRGAHRADIILPAAAYPEEAGPLRQHRGPPATRVPRELPARRGAGELGDPACAVGRTGCGPALEHHRPASRCAHRGGAAPGRGRRGAGQRMAGAAHRCARQGGFRAGAHRSLPVNPIARASTLMAELSAAAKARAAAPMAAE